MDSIACYLSRIEAALQSTLPKFVNSSWMKKIIGDDCPEVNTAQADSFLEPGRELLGRGGKRWRPLVTVLTCEALGGGQNADYLAPLTEIPHNGSLIVDDIEDSALTRRGGVAIHLKHGIDLAVNMGNLMYFLPTIVFENTNFDAETTLKMTNEWLAVMRCLHMGQGYDILWHRKSDLFPSSESYLRMCKLKTGSLASLAARLGVRAAISPSDSSRSTETVVKKMGAAWESIGTAFQILDDVQNLSSGVPGKNRGDDIVEGKKSLPVIFHIESHPTDAGRVAALLHAAAIGAPNGDWSAVHEAISLLAESGAIEKARDYGQDLLESGRRALLAILPVAPTGDLLIHMIEGFKKNML